MGVEVHPATKFGHFAPFHHASLASSYVTRLNGDLMNDYNDMTVAQLRTAVRERGITVPPALGGSAAIAAATKDVLVQALTDGTWPNVPMAPKAPMQHATPAAVGDAAAQMAAALQAMLAQATPAAAPMDEERVREIARVEAQRVAAGMGCPRIEVKVGATDWKSLPRQHERFPLLLACVGARVNALLVGPAGTGKTQAAINAAEACGLPFYMLSVGPQTSKSDIIGYPDSNRNYFETMFVKAYRDGGVFLLDEIDAGNAGVLTILNAALSGSCMPTPIGMLSRHPDFIVIAAANTFGHGADRQYVGRNQLDAATLDRFATIEWPLDEGLEAAMVGVAAKGGPIDCQGPAVTPEQTLAVVRKFREAVAAENIRVVVSPRATQNIVRLNAAGLSAPWCAELVLWRGMPADARKRVEGRLA